MLTPIRQNHSIRTKRCRSSPNPVANATALSDRSLLLYHRHLPGHRSPSPNRRSASRPSSGPLTTFLAGCWIEFIIKTHAFWIDISPARVKLLTASADDADGARTRYPVHDGDASDSKAWDGLLQAIGRIEKFNVLVHHADQLRQMWSEWLVEQQRLAMSVDSDRQGKLSFTLGLSHCNPIPKT